KFGPTLVTPTPATVSVTEVGPYEREKLSLPLMARPLTVAKVPATLLPVRNWNEVPTGGTKPPSSVTLRVPPSCAAPVAGRVSKSKVLLTTRLTVPVLLAVLLPPSVPLCTLRVPLLLSAVVTVALPVPVDLVRVPKLLNVPVPLPGLMSAVSRRSQEAPLWL